ncbi:DUF1705 domain-containing protein, partial [Stenotrophomonas maltophilia]|uniref:DUF1705 domain-containing protein n=1 Tax=Stenotrophomonas maltophilia TaxID=40324 RepID=UPI0034E25528
NNNPDQIQNVMQTDVDEAFDLLSVPFLLWIIQTVVLPLIVVFYIKIKPIQSIRSLVLDKSISLIIALFIMGLGLFSFYSQYAP